MTVLLAAAVAALASAAFSYLFNRLAGRRETAAEALVAALRDAQRSQFMLDLDNEDHAALLVEPLRSWKHQLEGLVGNTISDDLSVNKAAIERFSALLEWRMSEREARLRFAVTASGRSIKHLAEYHRAHSLHQVVSGTKTMELVDSHFHEATERLVKTVMSVRLPGPLLWLSTVARHVPVVGSHLVADKDLRVLIADYSERRPPTLISTGLSDLVGLGN